MNMDKNLISAVVLSSVFLMVWMYFFSPKPLPQPERIPASSEAQEAPHEAPAQTFAKMMGKEPRIAKAVEKNLESDSLKIVIDSRGASIKHWWVKEGNLKAPSGQDGPADLVNHPQGGDLLPLDRLPLATFPEVNFAEVPSVGNASASAWRAVLPSGILVEKKYSLEAAPSGASGSSHFVRLSLSFRNSGRETVNLGNFSIGWGQGLGTVESERKENADVTRVLAYPSPTKEVVRFKKSESQRMDYSWAAVDNRYYLLAMIPGSGQFDHIRAVKSKTEQGEANLTTSELILGPGETKAFELDVYGGPKGYTQLKGLGLGLEHSVDFGYFGFLGKWALKAMNTLNGWTGNYGWAIVILTGILQVLVFPLSLKSYKSMAAMKKLQPRIQELQKKYKEDPKKLNEETLKLYRESKTNPFGGCLPMLLQIPVFWAFFTMLRNSYELRGVPWILWIKDLSQHDPYYVLPIVMGGGMLLQQKISGSAGGDPAQAKIMMFMPVIFTFMFLKFPSGLVLYWLTNSILSIATQYWISKKYA